MIKLLFDHLAWVPAAIVISTAFGEGDARKLHAPLALFSTPFNAPAIVHFVRRQCGKRMLSFA
jgi:uncharacterized protein (DUF1810 family)